VLALENLLSEPVGGGVVVVEQHVEAFPDAAAGMSAKQIGQALGLRLYQLVRMEDRGRHDEELGADLHHAEEDGLSAFESGPVAHQRMDHRARQPARHLVHEAEVPGEASVAPVSGPERPSQVARRVPPGIVESRTDQGSQLASGRHVLAHEVAEYGELLSNHLACEKEAHDLRGALEDRVDAHVAQDTLHRMPDLSAPDQGVVRLVTPTAPDLHGCVGDGQTRLRGPQLGDRGLQTDVEAMAVGHA